MLRGVEGPGGAFAPYLDFLQILACSDSARAQEKPKK
jgi:hypothetical protein